MRLQALRALQLPDREALDVESQRRTSGVSGDFVFNLSWSDLLIANIADMLPSVAGIKISDPNHRE